MAPRPSTGPDAALAEQRVLGRLLGLYEEQRSVYERVLDLSRRQGEIVRAGGPLADVRRVLEEKKRCLTLVAQLETTERESKADWERNRHRWSAAGKARLHGVLSEVTEVIEEILACEEQSDLELIARTQVV
jgi:hypothetical protein